MSGQSTVEIYRRQEIGKLAIKWNGITSNENWLAETLASLKQIKKLVVVVESCPQTIQSCLRMLVILTKRLKELEIASQVVFPNENQRDVVTITGFDNFFEVWGNEKTAAQAMGITQLYPLVLIKIISDPPEPLAA